MPVYPPKLLYSSEGAKPYIIIVENNSYELFLILQCYIGETGAKWVSSKIMQKIEIFFEMVRVWKKWATVKCLFAIIIDVF